MTVTLVESRPVVLVVEDDERALDLRISAFADAGCIPVGAQTKEQAVQELCRVTSGHGDVILELYNTWNLKTIWKSLPMVA